MLLNRAAEMVSSTYPATCRGREVRQGSGLAALDLMVESMERRWNPSVRTNWATVVCGWVEATESGASLLLDLAGMKRTLTARLFREAGRLLDLEVTEGLRPLLATMQQPRARRVLSIRLAVIARGHAAEASRLLLDGALRAAHIDSILRETLLDPPDSHLAGPVLQEIIYLARSAVDPIKQLAARRLAGSLSPQARSTLRQLAYDPNPGVARTAVEAIGNGTP